MSDMAMQRPSARFPLALLMIMYACMNIDRSIMNILIEPVRADFTLDDTQLALLSSFAFAVCHGLAGIPFGLAADRYDRRLLIAGCLLTWSVVTSLGGFAQNAIQLFLSRIGVGVAEAGGSPAAVALIADIVPPERRALGLSIFYFGGPVGTVILFSFGAWLAETHGWRVALFAAGVPGVVLALLIALFVRDPRPPRARDAAEPGGAILGTIREMAMVPALRDVTLGITLCAMVMSAEIVWMISFLMRSHGMTLTAAGMLVALGYGVASAIGVAIGGFVTDRVGRDGDRRANAAVIAASCWIAAPLLALVLMARGHGMLLVALGGWSVATSVWFGPAFALSQDLADPRQRARVSALIYVLTGLVGFALGPQIVGIVSDLVRPAFGEQSLRAALAVPVLGHLAAGWLFWRARRTLPADLARAALQG